RAEPRPVTGAVPEVQPAGRRGGACAGGLAPPGAIAGAGLAGRAGRRRGRCRPGPLARSGQPPSPAALSRRRALRCGSRVRRPVAPAEPPVAGYGPYPGPTAGAVTAPFAVAAPAVGPGGGEQGPRGAGAGRRGPRGVPDGGDRGRAAPGGGAAP